MRNAVVAEMAIVGVDLATATAVADHAERATAIVEIRPVAVAIGDVLGRAGWKALSRRGVGRLAKSRKTISRSWCPVDFVAKREKSALISGPRIGL